MIYTLTYSNIHENEKSICGSRAFYLSKIARKGLDSCLFFVVTSTCLKEFIEHNSINYKVKDLLKVSRSEDDFWDDLKLIFANSSFPVSVENDLKNSYEALSISSDDSSNFLRSFEPRVNVIVSSKEDYGLDGIFLNIKGFNNLLNAIKSCWFYFIKKSGVSKLKKGFDFSFGVIVEKFVSADFSVEVDISLDKKNLIVSVYKGLPEVSQGILKDNYVLSFNHLEFINYELNNQNFSIIHQEKSGVLLKKRLGRDGADNKISKKVVSDCARLAKRVFTGLDLFVKVFFIVKKDVPYLFLLDSATELVEEDEVISDFVSDSSSSYLSEPAFSDIVRSENMAVVSEIVSNSHVGVAEDKDLIEEVSFDDSDEFIVHGAGDFGYKDDDFYSSFFKLTALLEEDLVKSYKSSFGFAPSSFVDAIFELDAKYGFSDKEKILKVFEVKDLIMQGEEIDIDIVSSLCGVMEDFLSERDDS